MKKILAIAAVAALTAGVSAYAANPFSDVTPNDWAYQAVSTLSDQGVVEGYPDGTFKGQQNITRYEMAQIVARLLAKEDQYNAEQKATIDKLAAEYADELNNLGVRVSALENKVGNIKFTGDARLRFSEAGDNNTKFDKTTGARKDSQSYTARIRINARATVNDSTYVHGRLETGNVDLKGGADADVTMDRLYVHHDFGSAVGTTFGKYEVDAGNQNSWFVSQTFDGAEAQFKLGDKAGLNVGYGRFNPDGADAEVTKVTVADGKPITLGDTGVHFKDVEMFYAQAKADLGVAKVGVDYFKANDYYEYEVVGGNLSVPFGHFNVFGDYYAQTKGEGSPAIWNAGLGYKAAKGDLSVGYFDVKDADKGLVYIPGLSGWQVSDTFLYNDGNFFYAQGNYALAKGVTLHAEYAFASDLDNSKKDLDDSYTVSLNYKF